MNTAFNYKLLKNKKLTPVIAITGVFIVLISTIITLSPLSAFATEKPLSKTATHHKSKTAQVANDKGYFEVSSNGKVFAFGNAHLYGSTVTRHLKANIVGFSPTDNLIMPSITTKSLPSGTVGKSYKTTINAKNIMTPYTWSIQSGNLPSGLSLNKHNGTIEGTPSTPGNSYFTVKVAETNSKSIHATAKLHIDIASTTATTAGLSPTTTPTSTTVTPTTTPNSHNSTQLTWSKPTQIDTHGVYLYSISCVSANFCAAVDKSGNAVTYSGTTWSKPTPIDTNRYSLYSISCVSANFCAAVDSAGNAVTYNGTTWSTPTPIDSYGDLNSISCVSANFCAAVDNSGNAVTYSGTTWSKPTQIDTNTSIFGLYSISCVSANFCAAVDGSGNVLTYNGTTWSKPTPIDSNGGGLTSISCASANFCVAVDAVGNVLTGSKD